MHSKTNWNIKKRTVTSLSVTNTHSFSDTNYMYMCVCIKSVFTKSIKIKMSEKCVNDCNYFDNYADNKKPNNKY